jgi:hypothetical protein
LQAAGNMFPKKGSTLIVFYKRFDKHFLAS